MFLSARAQDDDRARGLELGSVSYVTKPFDPVKLMELVRSLLAGGDAGTLAEDVGAEDGEAQ